MSEAEVVQGQRVIHALSAESAAVISRLKECAVGQIVTYAELSSIIGYNIRERRAALHTARRRLLADERMHFATVVGEGVRRINDAEAGRSLEHDVRAARSAGRRGLRKARAIDLTEVPKDERAEIVGRASLLALIDRAGAPRAQEKILAAVKESDATDALPLQRALAALRDG